MVLIKFCSYCYFICFYYLHKNSSEMVYCASLPTKLKSFSNFSRGLGGLTNGLLDPLCPDRTDRFIINPLHPNISMHVLSVL